MLPGSKKLPSDGPLVECPGCNPGFENNGTHCLLCENNYYNEDGRGGKQTKFVEFQLC